MAPFVLDTSVYIDLDIVDLGLYTSGSPVRTAISLGELAYGLRSEARGSRRCGTRSTRRRSRTTRS